MSQREQDNVIDIAEKFTSFQYEFLYMLLYYFCSENEIEHLNHIHILK